MSSTTTDVHYIKELLKDPEIQQKMVTFCKIDEYAKKMEDSGKKFNTSDAMRSTAKDIINKAKQNRDIVHDFETFFEMVDKNFISKKRVNNADTLEKFFAVNKVQKTIQQRTPKLLFIKNGITTPEGEQICDDVDIYNLATLSHFDQEAGKGKIFQDYHMRKYLDWW